MDKKGDEGVEGIRKEVRVRRWDMEKEDGGEFLKEVGEWGYGNGEGMVIEDEGEKEDDYEDR